MSELTKDVAGESAGIPRKWIILGVVKAALLLVAVGVVFSLYGCNTMRGIGQDIEKAGDAIQRSAN